MFRANSEIMFMTDPVSSLAPFRIFQNGKRSYFVFLVYLFQTPSTLLIGNLNINMHGTSMVPCVTRLMLTLIAAMSLLIAPAKTTAYCSRMMTAVSFRLGSGAGVFTGPPAPIRAGTRSSRRVSPTEGASLNAIFGSFIKRML